MKIAHISDIHININATQLGKLKLDKVGNNQLYRNKLAILKHCINTSLNNNVDLIILCGDIFDKNKPFPQEYVDLDTILKPAFDKVRIIFGNHDEMTSKGSGVEPLAAMGYKVYLDFTEENEIYYIPWGKLDLNKIEPRKIIALHAGVKDDTHHWVELENESGNADLTALTALKPHALMLGHHHNQTMLAPNIWYSGSLIVENFGEEKDNKGFLIWNTDTGEVEQISTKSLSPNYRTFSPEEFLNTDKGLDAIIRVKGEVSEQDRIRIIKKLKDFDCIDYKLELKIINKNKKIKTLSGKTDEEILLNYCKDKQIQNIEQILKLHHELE